MGQTYPLDTVEKTGACIAPVTGVLLHNVLVTIDIIASLDDPILKINVKYIFTMTIITICIFIYGTMYTIP